MATLFVRLPNHVGDAVMTMPALNLLEAAGFKLYLIGKPFVGEVFEGTNRSKEICLTTSNAFAI